MYQFLFPLIFSIEFIDSENEKGKKISSRNGVLYRCRHTMSLSFRHPNGRILSLDSWNPFYHSLKLPDFFHSLTFFISFIGLINYTLIGRPPIYKKVPVINKISNVTMRRRLLQLLLLLPPTVHSIEQIPVNVSCLSTSTMTTTPARCRSLLSACH